MKKHLRIIVILLIPIVLFSVVFISMNKSEQKRVPLQPERQDIQNTVTLVLEYGKGNSATYSGEYKQGMTAFSLLEDVVSKESIELKTKKYDFGTMVELIGGKANTKDLAWIYFINGNSGDVAADKKELNSRDLVEWKYIKPEW